MRFFHFLTLFCISAVWVEASAENEVKGHVGGEISIRCSGNWTTNGSSAHDSVYFCRGVCSSQNILIKAERRSFSLTRRGRYSVKIDGSDEVFNVTLQELSRADAGRYQCAVGIGPNVSHQHQIKIIVLDAPTVPPGSPPSSTATLQSPTHNEPREPSPSSNTTSPTSITPSPSEEKRQQRGASKLTGTTMVIIISGSLAFLVCAIIPLIFYGHWRSNSANQNRPEGSKTEMDQGEQNADAGSAQVAVTLQDIEPKIESESGGHDSSHYAAIYQALDPKALD